MDSFNFTSSDITNLVFAIVAIIVAFIIIKKVASCLIKAVVFAILLGVLAYLYGNFSLTEETKNDTDLEMTE